MRPWVTGPQPFNPGTPGPRTNRYTTAQPRPWPTTYQIPARGLGAMPVFGLGITVPIFNNAYAGGAPIYNIAMLGLSKGPFG
jgi:hypothetical protein